MNADKLFRRLTFASMVLLVAGAILFIAALSMPRRLPAFMLSAGVGALIGGLVLRVIVLVDRVWRRLLGRPPRSRVLFEPPTYTCHKCGYPLRGVKGAFCPECGTVRPSPLREEESA